MRLALWLLGLFAIASAVALFAGNNQGVVSLFWPPYRIDVSVNLALLVLAAGFVLLYLSLRGLSLFLNLPNEARRWRRRRRESAVFATFLDSLAQLQAGRFSRARKTAERTISLQDASSAMEEKAGHVDSLIVLSHLLAAESSQSLQDRGRRDSHLKALLALASEPSDSTLQAAREGAQMRSARWALDDRDPSLALQRLDALPQGAARRIVALRTRLKAARQAGQTRLALETTRALIRHRALSPVAASSMVRGLALEWIGAARDEDQLKKVWDALLPVERLTPELAIRLASRLCSLGGDRKLAQSWLMPIWSQLVDRPKSLDEQVRSGLVKVLDETTDAADSEWLARIENAQQSLPMDAELDYLAGMVCMKRQLWGKAQQLLSRTAPLLKDLELRRHAWVALAELALKRGETEIATQAWRQAAMLPLSQQA